MSTWPASLELKLRRGPRGTQLVRCAHEGPLYVQKTFHPEGPDTAHVYILHPPGGIVSGDALRIQVDVEREAAALITTPGAGRAYRAREDGRRQRQQQHFSVGPGARLEHLPQETILYPGAQADLHTRVELDDGARFIAWDLLCLGLPARGERFEYGAVRSCFEIRRRGRLCFRERLQLDAPSPDLLSGPLGWADQSVTGLLVAGPFDENPAGLVDEIRELCEETKAAPLAGVTWVSNLVVVRCLAPRAEPARRLFSSIWLKIRPTLLGVAACPPRVWAT